MSSTRKKFLRGLAVGTLGLPLALRAVLGKTGAQGDGRADAQA